MRLGERVRSLRAERNWTVRELQDEVYQTTFRTVSQGTVSKMESGLSEPGLQVLADIAAAFDLSAMELLEGTVYATKVCVQEAVS